MYTDMYILIKKEIKELQVKLISWNNGQRFVWSHIQWQNDNNLNVPTPLSLGTCFSSSENAYAARDI